MHHAQWDAFTSSEAFLPARSRVWPVLAGGVWVRECKFLHARNTSATPANDDADRRKIYRALHLLFSGRDP